MKCIYKLQIYFINCAFVSVLTPNVKKICYYKNV